MGCYFMKNNNAKKPNEPFSLPYSTLKNSKPYVIKNNKETISVCARLTKVEKNDRESWKNVIPASGSKDEQVNCHIYEVDLRDKKTFFATMLNLQYFFIRADRALSARGNDTIQYGLLIHVGDKDSVLRLRSYLRLQCGANARYNLLYRIGDENKVYSIMPLPDNKIGRLFPILRVVSNESDSRYGEIPYTVLASYYQNAIQDPYRMDSKSIQDTLKAYVDELNKPKMKNEDDESDAYGEKEMDSEITDPLNLFTVQNSYFKRILNNIKGKNEARMKPQEKEEIAKEFVNFFLEKRPHITLLGELFWLQYANQMFESKAIFCKDKSNHWRIDPSVYQKIYLDAITYSEGILQILENSCQHSATHSGYLTMRIHYVDRDAPDSKLLDVAHNRSGLLDRYQGLSHQKSLTASDLLKPFVPFYYETIVLDDASKSGKSRGITSVYRDNNPDCSEVDLYDIVADSEKCSKKETALVHHYGIAALRLTVERNEGVFVVSSPNDNHTETVFWRRSDSRSPNRETCYDKQDKRTETSEYHILFPLQKGNNNEQYRTDSDSNLPNELLESSILNNQSYEAVNTVSIEAKEILDEQYTNTIYLPVDQKEAKVEEIGNKLDKILRKDFDETKRPYKIIYLKLDSLNSLWIELLAKSLFLCVLKNPEQRFYAVHFSDFSAQQEFIRMFSIICNRSAHITSNPFFENGKIQIALCRDNAALQIPEVNFVLVGGDVATLEKTARRFAYYNSETSLELLPQIKYLSYSENAKNASTAPIFPFDLWLSSEISVEGKKEMSSYIAPDFDCWFINRIQKVVERSLQDPELGIKIADVHVHISSSIHVSDYYAAELLFHNIGVTYRFAYLAVKKMLVENCCAKKKLILVHYESYSGLLAQQIVDLLRKALGSTEIYAAQVSQPKMQQMKLSLPLELEELPLADRKKELAQYSFITLCPISSTLSTFYKMQDCVERELFRRYEIPKDPRKFVHNITILLVGDCSNEQIYKRYWATPTPSLDGGGSASLRQRGMVKATERAAGSGLDVHYMLRLATKWHDGKECAKYEEEKALVHTRSTPTELNMIFPPKIANNTVSKTAKGKNEKALNALEKCVQYGHILQGNNHYGFYLDLQKFYAKVSKIQNTQDDKIKGITIRDWFKELHSVVYEENAFNIIVTPMKQTENRFAKDVIDNVFEHSVRIFQINLHEARRTDIASKYSYITQDYTRIRQSDPTAKIRLYFVDDSIVMSQTLQRGLDLLRMLFSRSPEYRPDEHYFYDGVFLLVNRSSMDTIQNFVKNPEKDFHYYLHLYVPHYNTYRDRCPACARLEKYELLQSRSVTNPFAEEYQRQCEKHRLRTEQENMRWHCTQFWYSPSAYTRLKQWLENHPEIIEKNTVAGRLNQIVAKKQERFFREFEKQLNRGSTSSDNDTLVAKLKGDEHLQQRFLQLVEQETFYDSITDNLSLEEKRQIEEFWIQEVIGERSFIRAISVHEAYEKLSVEYEKENTETVYENILKLMKTPPEYICESEKMTDYLRWEWLYSCVKVLSRDYLLRHHEIYQCMFGLLRRMALVLLGQRELNLEKEREVLKGVIPEWKNQKVPDLQQLDHPQISLSMRCQMLFGIMHLLSNSQSNFVIMKNTAKLLAAATEKMTDTFFKATNEASAESLRSWYRTAIPSYRQIEFEYEKTIKLAALADDEESKCFLIQKEIGNEAISWAR